MLTAEVKRFILTNISSVPYLEALLLLRSEPQTAWTSSSLAKRLYISDKRGEELLSQLHKANIAQAGSAPDNYHYQPAFEELRKIIDELAASYSTNLLEITHLIHSTLDRKAQHFADAFKWRKDT